MIIISQIIHRNEARYKLEFAYNADLAGKIRTIKNAAWSQTQHAWLIPQTDGALAELQNRCAADELHFLDEGKEQALLLQQELNATTEVKADDKTIKPASRPIKIEVIGRKIILKMPKNDADIQFINTLKYSRWNSRMFCWEIPDYPGNIDLIKGYFDQRIDELVIHEKYDISLNAETRTIGRKELLIIKTGTGRLRLIFGFDPALIKLIKTFPYHSWDANNKWWTIPYADKYLNELQAYTLEAGIKTSYEEAPSGGGGVKRASAFDVPNYRDCPGEMILKLAEMRYSESTIKVYKTLFEEFINYYHKYDINTINETQVIGFLRFLVMERKVSISYQNQAINSIKFYYEKVLGGQRKFYFIDRPRKEKTLPTVLNEEEVIRLFKAVENKKHRCMLLLAYSAGLRLGEIIRLRQTDIDRERMQIRVEQSKGKRDRYAKLSARFLVAYDQYIGIFRPKDYVFEGAAGNEYSASSIQNVIKAAVEKAGIQKRTTMHTLRHTFATHSLENGVDLRYIQSMLGHESSKTTEVYTHITTKGFDQIKSPLDMLDI